MFFLCYDKINKFYLTFNQVEIFYKISVVLCKQINTNLFSLSLLKSKPVLKKNVGRVTCPILAQFEHDCFNKRKGGCLIK